MKFLIAACLLLTTLSAFALTPAEQKYLLNNKMGAVASQLQLGTALESTKKTVTITIDTATVDGSSTFGSVGLHSTGVVLPAGALITRSYYETKTQFVDAGAGTVALNCETADNILAAADITGEVAGSLHDGVSTGSLANFKKVTNACSVYIAVAAADQSAGKLNLILEYSLNE